MNCQVVENVSFVITNATNNGGFNPPTFSSGAGCEAGFYQAFNSTPATPPNNILAMEFDSYSPLTDTTSFTYSNVQLYQTTQSPCNPNDGGPNYWTTNKISTSPVPLNSPAGTPNSFNGDTFSATLTYDGTNLTLNMYDVTAGGSCPGTRCFTQTWSAMNIPSIVNGDTAYVGFTAASGGASDYNLYINSLVYTVNSAPASPSLTTYTSQPYMTGTTPTANPTYSPPAGTYSGTQNVTISTSTSGGYMCYALGASPPSIMPQPDNMGGCQSGTLYSGPVSISSTQTLYAVAGTVYSSLPSNVIAGAYTISGGTTPASTPTFSPVAGTYTGTQSVTLSTSSSGTIICYSTTGSPATNGSTGCATGTLYTGPVTVSSSETLYAVAGGTGHADSSVGSASYVIQGVSVSTPTFSPAGGAYSSAQLVTIWKSTSGATIYYTTNGTTPTTSSTAYTGPITVSTTETLQAMAVATGDTNSAVASATYTITPVVSTPTFSPAAGTYTSAQSVSISDATSGATIYYTTNGTTPTTSSTAYTGPITVGTTETLEAIAVAAENLRGADGVGHLRHTAPVVSTPTFSPVAGVYTSAQSVSISDATSAQPSTTRPTELRLQHPRPGTPVPLRLARRRRCRQSRQPQGTPTARSRRPATPSRLWSQRRPSLLPRGATPPLVEWYYLGCHFGRNHLLHDQRNDAGHVLDPVHRSHYG